jgi:DNA-binding response OmpR family regulator
MMSTMRILVLDDDSLLRRSVADALSRLALAVDEAATLREAHERLLMNEYDLAVLDRRLPDGDAVVMLGDLRKAGLQTSVIFLTGLGEVGQRVEGLDVGADDYLVKPFAMEELLARVRTLLRRTGGDRQPLLELGDVSLDPARMCVTRAGLPLTLTPKEFSVLAYLIRQAGRVVSRTELLEHCWDEFADPSSNVIDVRIRLLRGKLGDPPIIHTVRGGGYLAELTG